MAALRFLFTTTVPSCTTAASSYSTFASPLFVSWSNSACFGCRLVSASQSKALIPSHASRMGSSASSAAISEKSLHEFTVKGIDGNDVDLSAYNGKVLLVVNVASQCGLTKSNYEELTKLYTKYKDSGLEILAFPSNQFGGQEPGSNEQIKDFACSRYKAEFPLFDKIDVNGPNTAPVYNFLKSNKGGGILGDSIKWNFTKFLVDKNGKVVDRYAPTTSPSKIEGDIQKLLKG